MMSARGALAVVKRSASPRSVDANASPNATVLPDPVCADTSRSRSPGASMIAAWTGVGSL
jgi:hypothetical protein